MTPFNAALYGRGVLDFRAALIYAEIKSQNRNLRSDSIYEKMKRRVAAEDNKAATRIQSVFRGHALRKTLEQKKDPMASRNSIDQKT